MKKAKSAAPQLRLLPRPKGKPPPSTVRVEDGFNDTSRPVCSPAMKLAGGAATVWVLVYAATAGLRHSHLAIARSSGALEFRGEGGKLYADGVEFHIKGAAACCAHAVAAPRQPLNAGRHCV